MPDIRVVITDDHPVVLEGIRSVLMGAEGVCLVGEATTAQGSVEVIERTRPDIAVIDLSLPDGSGYELAQSIARTSPESRVLVLTVHEDRAYVQQLMQAGCRGYLLKRSAAEELVRAVRTIHAGGVYLDPSVAEKALGGPAGEQLDEFGSDSLSPRERDVVRLTAQGFSNKEIAAKIDVSIKSVETYKARALEKLSIRTRAEIVRYGSARGWLDGLAEP
jgi:DNA-binding NarL/FixJ family response regulator